MVAPFTGAWIEILSSCVPVSVVLVAPFTGAWIEIERPSWLSFLPAGRSLHGSVD